MTDITPHRSKTVCKICRGPLTVHQEVRGGVCDNPRCRNAMLHLGKRRAEEHRAKIANCQGLSHVDDLPLAVVPCYDPSIRNLPEKRRRLFRDHLTLQISRAVAVSPGELTEDEYPVTLTPTPPEKAFLTEACRLCRGYCCTQGGTRAWMDAPTIMSHMANHPENRPRHVLEAYLDLLPKKSCQGSCVYHTEDGCTLPRSMRANICNRYYCRGQCELWDHFQGPDHSHALIIAMDRNVVIRSKVVLRRSQTLPDDG